MNFDHILKYTRPRETYYDILGCAQTSSFDQINREYKIRALQLHPDKNPDPMTVEKFRLLQVAKDVLSDETTRKSYDTWLNSRIMIPFEQWQTRKGHSMHWASPRQTKLSIQENRASQGQGSDLNLENDSHSGKPNVSLLEKFRNYEV